MLLAIIHMQKLVLYVREGLPLHMRRKTDDMCGTYNTYILFGNARNRKISEYIIRCFPPLAPLIFDSTYDRNRSAPNETRPENAQVDLKTPKFPTSCLTD